MVDGIEEKTKGRLSLLRIDVNDDTGKEIALKYHISSVPAFVLLDTKGNVVWALSGKVPEYNSLDEWLREQKK